jgi:hypothetical protein
MGLIKRNVCPVLIVAVRMSTEALPIKLVILDFDVKIVKSVLAEVRLSGFQNQDPLVHTANATK